MKSYAEKLKDPRWQKKRLEILERDNWGCINCGNKKSTLHVHHNKYYDNPWGAPEEELETLCNGCHKQHHKAVDSLNEKIKTLDRGGIQALLLCCCEVEKGDSLIWEFLFKLNYGHGDA